MVSKQFEDFSKEILTLNKLSEIKQSESILFDCNYILETFGLESLKKLIKMFLFCIGACRYDFNKKLSLKIDPDIIDMETIIYIINLIRFTGRKNQIDLIVKITDNIPSEQFIKFQSFVNIQFYSSFKQSLLNSFEKYPVKFIIFEKQDLMEQEYLNKVKNSNMVICIDTEDWIKNKVILKHCLVNSKNIKIGKPISNYAKLFAIIPMEDLRKELLELYNSNI